MSLFIDKDTLTIPSHKSASEKTADDILQMVQNRITKWAENTNYGAKKPDGIANILVERTRHGKKGKFLLIKIANRTLTAMQWDSKIDGKTQIEACIKALQSEKDNLLNLYKQVCNQLPNGKTAKTGTDLVEVA